MEHRIRNLFSTGLFIALLSLNVSVLAQFPGPGNTLQFDGSNDFVGIPTSSTLPVYLKSGGTYTVEFWVIGLSGQDEARVFSESNRTNNDAPLFNISTGRISVGATDKIDIFIRNDAGTNLINHQVSTDVVFDGTWHHVAWVDNNGTTNLYIDGVDNTISDYIPTGTFSLDASTIAALDRRPFPGPGDTNFFQGQVDELRIWNVARTQQQIRDNMCKKLTGTETGLVAYYRFDANAGTSTLTDLTSNHNNGTLVNMNTATAWKTSGAAVGDTSANVYTGTWTGQTVKIGHSDGDTLTISNVSGTTLPSGVHVYRVDEAPNVTTPPGAITSLDPLRYWGVYVAGGSGVTYDVTYNYTGHPGITNESTLDLASRANNGTTSWTEKNATLNTAANTLSLVNETQSEYILGSQSPDNPLPVELTSFTASLANNGVELKWITESEINNLGFEIWRSIDNEDNFQKIAGYNTNEALAGSGNSNTRRIYQYYDGTVEVGHTYYYTLWDVSFSGERTRNGTIEIDVVDNPDGNEPNLAHAFELFQNYPNPFNPSTQIGFSIGAQTGGNSFSTSLVITDMLGKQIRTLVNENLPAGEYFYTWDGRDDAGNLVSSGVYIYFLQIDGRFQGSKKMVFLR